MISDELRAIELQSASVSIPIGNKRREQDTPICNAFRSKLFYILIVVILLLITAICFCLTLLYEKEIIVTSSMANGWREELSLEKSVWFDAGLDELKAALNVKVNTRRAKNVVLFVGDGMGVNTVTATRITKYGEEGRLAWETFPHMASLKVSSRNICH